MNTWTVNTIPQQLADCALLLAVGNTAQQVVAISCAVADPVPSNWAAVAVGMGAVPDETRRHVYRFPDGSAIRLIGNALLPVQFIG